MIPEKKIKCGNLRKTYKHYNCQVMTIANMNLSAKVQKDRSTKTKVILLRPLCLQADDNRPITYVCKLFVI